MQETKTLEATKEALIKDLEKRVADKILEPQNKELLEKLILQAKDTEEALAIAALGTTYKKTGFHFDKRLERSSDNIFYLKERKDLSFTQNPRTSEAFALTSKDDKVDSVIASETKQSTTTKTQSIDCHEANASRNDEAQRAEAVQTPNTQGRSILDEKSGLCGSERGNKTKESVDEVSDKLHDFNSKDKPTLTHQLIIGDNYPALLNLLISYREKIKVIYIDPPYGKDDLGEFAKTNYDNAITRDNLLSMLYPRLQLARQLLRDDGVIFCSIDDRNQAYVKCLFDEVFGEGNFVSSFVWQKKSGGGQAKYFYEGHEYILIYAKTKNEFQGLYKFKKKASVETDFLRKIHGKYTNNPKLKMLYEKYPNELIEHRNLMFEEMDIFLKENMITQEKYNEVKENIENGTYFLKEFNDNFHLVCRYNESNKTLMYSILSGDWTSDGNNENEDIFIDNNFKDPKPVNFIKQIIQSVTTLNNQYATNEREREREKNLRLKIA